ncbi:universal stress protein [Streptomyces bobili]|uniref:universal stress protein n=1 Tax=Streptomyces bobili TaxID=67280 RepID=UPI0036537CD0
MSGPVVVGVDGSPASLKAVEFAAWEAGLRGVGLRLAHAFAWPSAPVPPGAPPWDPDGVGLTELVNGTLAEAEQRAHAVAPQVNVTSDVLVGEPATVLQSESRIASLTVVDGRRTSRLDGLLHGSVAGRLTARGCCPVLVVRGRQNPTGPVVLAYDASPAARAAAEFALAEASVRGADLVVLRTRHLWAARPTSSADLADVRKEYPDVSVDIQRVTGWSGRTVVEASAGAQLVVIGAPEWSRVVDVLPVASRAVLRHGHCPVAVVPSKEV